jgi:hypothetical protein
MKLEFSRQIFEEYSNIKKFMKIRSVGAEFFHAERQTERQTNMLKLILALHNFANAPKNEICKQITESLLKQLQQLARALQAPDILEYCRLHVKASQNKSETLSAVQRAHRLRS